MVSKEGEVIDFVKSIFPHQSRGNVEEWLLELENQMKASVQQVIYESVLDYDRNKNQRNNWIKNWQGQVVLAVT